MRAADRVRDRTRRLPSTRATDRARSRVRRSLTNLGPPGPRKSRHPFLHQEEPQALTVGDIGGRENRVTPLPCPRPE